MMSWITLVVIAAALGGLYLLAGVLDRMGPLPEDPPCPHEATTYSATTGVTRCIQCGTPTAQEFWD